MTDRVNPINLPPDYQLKPYLRDVKKRIQSLLQRIFGFDRYLLLFSWFKIHTLRSDRKERDFFHFLGLIPPNSTVLDIGANIGIMTVHLASLRGCMVHAFEPNKHNLRALNRIIKYFGVEQVCVHPYALGSRPGEAKMLMPVHQSVRMQGLSHIVEGQTQESGEWSVVEVKRLDDVAELFAQPITAIKIDVENYESQVLEGARELLNRCRPFVYAELWDNANRDACFQLMRSLGYSIAVLDNKSLQPFDGSQRTQNFFFMP